MNVGMRPRRTARPKVLAQESLSSILSPGNLVYVPGASGAPLDFMAALARHPEHQKDLKLLTSYVPGINALDMDAFVPSARVTGLFMQPGLREAQRVGRFRCLPMSYAQFVAHVRDHVSPDLAVVQLSPPDDDGNCSLGPAVEFSPSVLSKAKQVLGIINHQTPRIPGAVSIAYSQLDYACEVDTALPEYLNKPSTQTNQVAQQVAALIEDNCTVQMGLGKVPAALMPLLHDRRRLRLHSGMLSDGLPALIRSGALDAAAPITTCVLVGSSTLYRELGAIDSLRVVGCETSHDAQVMARLNRFISVNSALEVDLFGQCNLEHANGRAISGAGGAPDFARAARLSRGGRSIVALNATNRDGTSSRIVHQLDSNAITSLCRVDVDCIATEYGIAHLHGASVHERARAIIGVAAPQFREELSRAWSAIAARL